MLPSGIRNVSKALSSRQGPHWSQRQPPPERVLLARGAHIPSPGALARSVLWLLHPPDVGQDTPVHVSVIAYVHKSIVSGSCRCLHGASSGAE
jgi:hypothetical protein